MLSTSEAKRGLFARRRVWASFAICLGIMGPARGQEAEQPVVLPPADAVVVAPAAPVANSLDSLIGLAMGQQPALAAARASLAAAESSKRGLDSLTFGALFAPDLPIRKKQACLGITIASAGLQQAEWETRYAVTRTYYTVQYARQQRAVVDSVIEKLKNAHEKAKRFVDAGDPNIKVTQIDVDTLALNQEFAKAKRAEADTGIQKAMAALREAVGVNLDFQLIIADEPLPALVPNIDKNSLIAYALANRGEMAQASAASEVSELEICAQKKSFNPVTKTFASGSDIHAKQIPQGVANGEYRPGAVGLEMPVFMAGRKSERVARAANLNERSHAVVDKTHNLIQLEVEVAYLKWVEAAERIRNLQNTPDAGAKIASKVQGRFDAGNVTGEELLRARTLEDYARSQYNEALFNHALGLAMLERVTAGGYRMPAR